MNRPNLGFKKKHFIYTFCCIVLCLALIRCVFPSVAESLTNVMADKKSVQNKYADSIEQQRLLNDSLFLRPRRVPVYTDMEGKPVHRKIYSVPGFKQTFPDLNDVQLATAQRLGVKPVRNRRQAEQRQDELVYVGSSPYYYVQDLQHSIPYLIPRASHLLNYIGRTFLDSLQVKQIPLHTLIVTSVLRTEEDIAKLRRHNVNATEQSCHRFGTTFDISYNRYCTVEDPDGPKRRQVRTDTLKWVLSEVLRDLREAGSCYVKYEVKQGCYHITVR